MALYPKNQKDFPVSKIYKRVGIRRENNLGDLSNSAEGLKNLLDSLVDDQINESFAVEDLSAVKNIFASGLESDGYQKIIGSSVKFTTPDGLIAAYDPRITYQNRIDKFQLFSGEPRLAGGNGLTAKYYQNDQVNFNSLTSFQFNKSNGNPFDPNLSESDVFLSTTSEGLIPDDNFWEHGEFEYTGKVHPQSVKASGGVKWEGYYIPRKTGRAQFTVTSTGFFTMDFSKEGYFEDDNKNQTTASLSALPLVNGIPQVYTNYMRVGISTVVTATGNAGNEVTVPLNRIPTIAIGMVVSGSNINSTNGAPVVESINRETGVLTLTPASGQTNSVTGSLSGSNNVTFSRTFGDECSTTFKTQVLLAYEKYRIRIRYFHPKVESGDFTLNNQIRRLDKRITIHHAPPGQDQVNDLDFRYLYALDHDFSDTAKGGFNRYLDNSVLFGGTILGVGIGKRDDFNQYTRLKSTGKVDLKYKVKESLAKITRVSSRLGTFSAGNRIITMDLTSNIEIGNYVFGTNIPDGTRVESIAINNFVIVDRALGGSGSQNQNLTFIDHRGFVKKVTGSHSGSTISGITPALKATSQNATTIDTDVQVGMVAIGEKLNSYSKITSLTTNSMQISRNVTSTGSADVYIYQSRGLKDNSIEYFCDRFSNTPEVRCLRSNHQTTNNNGDVVTYVLPGNSGITTVKVNNLNGVGANWELQGAYFTSDTDTTASAGIEVNQVLANNVLELKNPITKPLPDDAQFTAVNGNTRKGGDYQLCCPPTDTSPPFNASEDGLETISGTTSNMEIHKGNLIFDSLIIQDTNSNASTASASDTVNRKIEIKTPLSTSTRKFKILATI